jgi:hypothetical protein
MPNQVDQEKEMIKSQDVNIGKRDNIIVPSKQKGKSVVQKVLEKSKTKERPWIEVGSNDRFSRYHKENFPLQQRQELIYSSNNPIGFSNVIPHQSQGKSKPWYES